MSDLLIADSYESLISIIENNDRVVVEFGAAWCGPCRQFLPHFTKFAEDHDEFVCVKVDVDSDPAFMTEYNIMSVPQVFLFEGGQKTADIKARTVIQLEQELA